MKFQRVTSRVLPNGQVSKVYPFHVCTEGLEDRIICKDNEDLRVAHNFIPICARRTNVIVFADCELHTHMHSGILAASYNDANRFANCYKASYSRYYSHKHNTRAAIYQQTDSRPTLLEDDNHVRNTLCYIPRNSLDLGIPVDKYEFSSHRALFCNGKIQQRAIPVSEMKYRERRSILCTSDKVEESGWMVNECGLIEPASYCDWEYSESAFFNDPKYYLRKLGITDDAQMGQSLVRDKLLTKPLEEILHIAEEKSVSRYGRKLEWLTMEQKIPIIKSMFYAYRISHAQLARCFSIKKEDIGWILGK